MQNSLNPVLISMLWYQIREREREREREKKKEREIGREEERERKMVRGGEKERERVDKTLSLEENCFILTTELLYQTQGWLSFL